MHRLKPYIGNGDYLFMKGVARAPGTKTPTRRSIHRWHGAIPRLTHMLFQGMFFIITPALICGAFAERMKFSAMVLFMILWGTFVYCPLCHWVWGGGMLAYTPAEGVTPLHGRRARLCRRHGRAYQLRRFRADLRAVSSASDLASATKTCGRTT